MECLYNLLYHFQLKWFLFTPKLLNIYLLCICVWKHVCPTPCTWRSEGNEEELICPPHGFQGLYTRPASLAAVILTTEPSHWPLFFLYYWVTGFGFWDVNPPPDTYMIHIHFFPSVYFRFILFIMTWHINVYSLPLYVLVWCQFSWVYILCLFECECGVIGCNCFFLNYHMYVTYVVLV